MSLKMEMLHRVTARFMPYTVRFAALERKAKKRRLEVLHYVVHPDAFQEVAKDFGGHRDSMGPFMQLAFHGKAILQSPICSRRGILVVLMAESL